MWMMHLHVNQKSDYDMVLDPRKPVFRALQTTRRRSACASAQSDQHLYYSLIVKYHSKTCYKLNFTILASLCSWFESSFFENPEKPRWLHKTGRNVHALYVLSQGPHFADILTENGSSTVSFCV